MACCAGSLMACHMSEGDGGKHVYCGFWGKEKAWQGKEAEGWLVCIVSAGSGAQGLPLLVWYVALGNYSGFIVVWCGM